MQELSFVGGLNRAYLFYAGTGRMVAVFKIAANGTRNLF
jgi:hypothetical protein